MLQFIHLYYTQTKIIEWSNIHSSIYIVHYPDTDLIVYPSSYGQDVDLYENHGAHDNTIDDIIRIPRLPSSADILHTVQNASCQKRDRSLFPYTFFRLCVFIYLVTPQDGRGHRWGLCVDVQFPLGKIVIERRPMRSIKNTLTETPQRPTRSPNRTVPASHPSMRHF